MSFLFLISHVAHGRKKLNNAAPIKIKAAISLGGYTRRASDGAGTDAGLCVCSCLGTDTWADTDSVDGFGTGGFYLLLSHML